MILNISFDRIFFITECAFGFYGTDCKQNCPGYCRKNVTCNQFTGVCNEGCVTGWVGLYCNKSNFVFDTVLNTLSYEYIAKTTNNI